MLPIKEFLALIPTPWNMYIFNNQIFKKNNFDVDLVFPLRENTHQIDKLKEFYEIDEDLKLATKHLPLEGCF